MSGINLNTYTQNWGTFGTQGAQGTQRTQGAQFKDDIVTLGNLDINFNYKQDTGSPSLLKPNEYASDQSQQNWPGTGSKEPSYQERAFSLFAENLEQFAQKNNLTEKQVNEMVFASLTGEQVPDDTFLNDVLTELQGKVGEEMLQTFGEDAFPSVSSQAKAVKGEGGSFISTAKGQLAELQDYVNSLPEGAEKQKLQKLINQAQGNLKNIGQTLSQLGEAKNRSDFSNLLKELNDQMASFKQNIQNTGANDPLTGSVLAKFQSSINSSLNTFSNNVSSQSQANQWAEGNWNASSSDVAQAFKSGLQKTYSGAFGKALSQYAESHGLSKEEVAKIKFAEMHPEAAVDPKIKGMLKEVSSQALSSLSPSWGLPPGYVPKPDSSQFDAKVEVSYDQAFEQLLKGTNLSELAKQLGVSENQVSGALEYLHNHPEQISQNILSDPSQSKALLKFLGFPENTNLSKLAEMLSSLDSQAFQQIAQKYGLPSGYTVQPGTVGYDAKVNGRFLQQFEHNLKNQKPPLSKEEINNVLQAIKDPLNPNISSDTKALIQKIYSQSVGDIRAEYNLPANWAPPVVLLAEINNTPLQTKIASAGIRNVEESLGIMAKAVSQLPDSPSKASILNIMKIVSEALANLKSELAKMQALNSEYASKLVEAKKEDELYKVHLQMDKMEEARKKKQKMAGLSKFMKIFGPMMKVIMAVVAVVLAVAGGPLGIIIAAAMLTFTIMDIASNGKLNPMTKLFTTIMENVKPKALAIMLNAAIAIGLGVACGGVAGIMIGMQLFFENSGVIQAIVEECGGSKMAAEITNAVCQAVTEIVVMIVLSIVSGGAAMAGLVAVIVMRVARIAAKVLRLVAKVLEMVGKTVEKIAEVVERLIKALERIIVKMEELLKGLKSATKGVNEAKSALKDVAKTGTKKGIENAEKALKEAKKVEEEAIKAIMKKAAFLAEPKKAIRVFDLVSQSIQGVNSIQQGVIDFNLGKIEDILAEMDAEIEEVKNLIKLLDVVLRSLMNGVSENADWMKNLGQQDNSMWTNLTQLTSTIASANGA